jgi:hypothetical protein
VSECIPGAVEGVVSAWADFELDWLDETAPEEGAAYWLSPSTVQFLRMVLAPGRREPPPDENYQPDYPPTDNRLIDYWHQALSELIVDPYECPPEGQMVEIVAGLFQVDDTVDGGSLAVGDNPLPLAIKITRDDVGAAIDDDGYWVMLPGGKWVFDLWQIYQSAAGATFAQLFLYGWAVPSPQVYYYGGLLRATSADWHVITAHIETADLGAMLWEFYLYSSAANAAGYALGYHKDGRECNYGGFRAMRISESD